MTAIPFTLRQRVHLRVNVSEVGTVEGIAFADTDRFAVDFGGRLRWHLACELTADEAEAECA